MRFALVSVMTMVAVPTGALGSKGALIVKHVDVYKEPGRFGGWPANHGIWSWGNEIVVGFSAGYYKDLGPTRHHIDRKRPEEHLLARSRDGGGTEDRPRSAWQNTLPPMKR